MSLDAHGPTAFAGEGEANGSSAEAELSSVPYHRPEERWPSARLPVASAVGRDMVRVAAPPLGGWYALVKWLEDKLIATLALGLLAPVLVLIALAIRIDSPGPVLFRCRRFGLNGSEIEVLKLRTMYVGLTDRPDKQTSPGDFRVTRLGRWLRRTSLDELPQLINVLRGELSIVGPRPHPVDMKIGEQPYHQAVPRYAARHRVKPGITGLAQVSGHRGEIRDLAMAEQRVALDLEYIEHWSLWLDLRIIISTVRKLFSDERAC